MRVELEPSYILHARPYRETSMIVYALTEHHGIVHMISKGARKKGNSQLQPFIRMYLSWSGKSDLVSLAKIELEKSRYTRNFRAQVQCFYLHELILKLIPRSSPAPELFYLYQNTIELMTKNPHREEVLRNFELQFLSIMGHPLQLKYDYVTDREIKDHLAYRYVPDHGPTQCDAKAKQWDIVTGKVLKSLDDNGLMGENLSGAKFFLRGLINYYLQGKPLVTRQLLKVN